MEFPIYLSSDKIENLSVFLDALKEVTLHQKVITKAISYICLFSSLNLENKTISISEIEDKLIKFSFYGPDHKSMDHQISFNDLDSPYEECFEFISTFSNKIQFKTISSEEDFIKEFNQYFN